ncbi:MAG: ABC transporter substrate-binding protein [Hellea sp.]|nr:ABC transporter substrate-binding protein [Hellea sp.]
MPLRAAVFSVVCALASSSASAAEPDTIASTSLCGDSYLLALMGNDAPEKLVAMSWQSRDPVSSANDAQKSLPQIWDNPESYLSSGADLVVFGPGEGVGAERFLTKAGINAHHLNWVEDFDGVFSNLESLGAAVDQDKPARRMIADISLRLDRLEALPDTPKILYLARSGFSAGPGTFVDAAMTAAGGENIVTEPGWPKLDPEYLITLKPDLIVTSFFDDGYESVNAAAVRHHTVRQFIDAHNRLEIPGSVWPCAGPGLIDAAEMIHASIKALP